MLVVCWPRGYDSKHGQDSSSKPCPHRKIDVLLQISDNERDRCSDGKEHGADHFGDALTLEVNFSLKGVLDLGNHGVHVADLSLNYGFRCCVSSSTALRTVG